METENIAVAENLEPLVSHNVMDNEFEDLGSIPHWYDQITIRGLVASAFLGTLFCIMVHRLNLTLGIVPGLNMSAALLGFFVIHSWTGILSKFGFSVTPFTRQENTVIQTCVVACYGLASSGGFGSYMLAMDERTYQLVGVDYPGNHAEDVKNPALGWIITLLFFVSFLGLFRVVMLRKVMITDNKLTFPSGTATATLINSFFHKNMEGADLARKQVGCLGKYLSTSFCWSCFKWFFSGVGDSCGFDTFPSLGLTLFKKTFYFDFSLSYVGCGLICPHIVNCSVLVGAIMSQGFLLPFISKHDGDWYPADLSSNDLNGIGGYKIFIGTSLILGDGLYNLIKLIIKVVNEMFMNSTNQNKLPITDEVFDRENSEFLMDQRTRDEIFMQDGIPHWFSAAGYIGLAASSAIMIPIIFPSVKWYMVIILHVIAPVLSFCNSYGAGLTDSSLPGTYGKIGLLVIAPLVGSNGGVIAGLVACGVITTIVSTAADLMQDFKTGYLTLSSAKSMFVSQLVGTAMGCVIAPLTFWLFWTAFDIGSPDSPYKAPYAVVFREVAILVVGGFSNLPKYCVALSVAFFIFTLVINFIRDVTPTKVSQFIPFPMAMALPLYVGGFLGIDLFIGTLIRYTWERTNWKDAENYLGAVASGLMCGDGIWTIPSAILSIFQINPPICMYFRRT